MKKILLIVFIGVLFSCTQSKEDIIKANVEKWAKENTNNPESFKILSLEFVDSIPFKNNIKHRKDMFSNSREFAQEQLNYAELNTPEDSASILKNQKTVLKYTKYIEGIDQIAQSMGNSINNAAAYKFQMKAKGKNAMGAEITNTFIVLADPAKNWELIQVTADESKVLVNPKDFPGYIDMLDKVGAEFK